MAIFEAGILTKMTENEYEESEKFESDAYDDLNGKIKQQQPSKVKKAEKDNEKLEPINIKMLQGAFYLLLIGYFFSGNSPISIKYIIINHLL